MVSLSRSLTFLSTTLAFRRAPVDSTTRRQIFSLATPTSLFLATASTSAPSQRSPTSCQATTASSNNSDMNTEGLIRETTGFVSAKDAYELDVELMQQPGYTLEQLMELAGLSCAEAVHRVLDGKPGGKILIVCGPGNNGGDGLVAARHLVLFGYESVVVYPKRPFAKQPHYENLVEQCQDFNIPVLDELPDDLSGYAAMVDAMFGFSFKGVPREPFASFIASMMDAQTQHDVPIIAVDIPSGWHVNDGDVNDSGFAPHVLVSLTAPKPCSLKFEGRHFVGGRFLPPHLAEKYDVRMPPYEGTSQVYELSTKPYDWAADYAAHCAEEQGKAGTGAAASSQGGAKQGVDPESWEAQYDEYLKEKAEKEKAQDS